MLQGIQETKNSNHICQSLNHLKTSVQDPDCIPQAAGWWFVDCRSGASYLAAPALHLQGCSWHPVQRCLLFAPALPAVPTECSQVRYCRDKMAYALLLARTYAALAAPG